MSGLFGTASSSSAALSSAAGKDAELVDPPADSISSLAWAPNANLLAAGAWDHTVRVWEVGASGQSAGKALYTHDGPVLSVCWSADGRRVFSGGADNAGRMLDLERGPSGASQVAAHDAPIKAVRWVDAYGGLLVTGSWDKTVKYWDLRQAAPVASVQLPERCYSLDVRQSLMVVGCAERHIVVFDLTKPTVVHQTIVSPLKWQTRTVACYTTADGFALGSVEGRAAMHYVGDKDTTKNYTFKCHRQDQRPGTRDQSLVYAVNGVGFHPRHPSTFFTVGADGAAVFWDRDARTRLASIGKAADPIVAGAWNGDGSLFAYAVSYDWHQGHAGNTVNRTNKIIVHPCKDEEVQKRALPRR